jgi:voltage-gated potassium channel
VIDAFYYIIVTGTTIGYDGATPTPQVTKLFRPSVIVLGTGAFTVATGSLLVSVLESRISNAFRIITASELTLLEDHVLVLGHGDPTEPLMCEPAMATEVNVLTADPTDEMALRDVRVDSARGVVVTTDNDARDTLAVVAARQADPDVRIVAAATDRRHVDKLDAVGADEVTGPAVIGGRLPGRSVLGERAGLLNGVGGDENDGAVIPDAGLPQVISPRHENCVQRDVRQYSAPV